MFCTCGAIAGGSASMGTNQRYCIASDIAIAVCLRRESEIASVGCRKTGGCDFVEMITGDWLEGPAKLSAGWHIVTTAMSIDRRAPRAMNVPVSRGPIRRLFLGRLARHENESLQLRALTSAIRRTFLSPVRRAYRMLRHICAAGRDTFRVPEAKLGDDANFSFRDS
jgi:hypothetical protein